MHYGYYVQPDLLKLDHFIDHSVHYNSLLLAKLRNFLMIGVRFFLLTANTVRPVAHV